MVGMTDSIKWEAPGPKNPERWGQYQTELNAFVQAVTARPGEWAIYKESMKTRQSTQNRVKYPGTEWTSRANKDTGGYTIYGRYVGDE